MNIFFGCLLVTSFVISYVHSIDYVIIPETCTEPLFACPDDCTKYYVCLHGRPFKMPCGPGTHWNDRLKVCDWPYNANCVEVPTIHPGQPIPTEPSTTLPPLKPVTPTKPAPTKPTPTKTVPTKPAPTKSAPTKPAPTKPAPTKPAPTKPIPTKPAPTKPAPTKPTPTKPVPTETAPTQPAPTQPQTIKPTTESTPIEATTTEPWKPITPPFEPTTVEPSKPTSPTESAPTESTTTEPWKPITPPTEPTTVEPSQPVTTPTESQPTESTTTEPWKPITPPVEKPELPKNTTDRDVGMNRNMKVICYFTNAASREPVRYQPEDVQWNLCTHIVYAFAISDPETYTIRAGDPWADIDNKYYEKITDSRQDGVKILISVNGLVDNIDGTPNPILTDFHTRKKFVESAVEFIEKYNFDGLELDLEYASCAAEECESQILQERFGFVPLMQDLSAALRPRGWLLSATASADRDIIDLAYDIPQWSALLNWISLMTFDYHSSIDGRTGHKSPIYSNDAFNIDSTVNYFINKGAAPQKLIVGISGYGQSYTLSSEDNAIDAITTGPGKPGPYSQVRGLVAYYEICDYTKKNGWTVVRDPDGRQNTYAYSDSEWVSYDDVDNVRAKAKYIQKMGLGGGLFWTMDFDDFTGKCGCGRYPLLTAFNQELRNTGGKPIHNCT